MFLQFDVVGNVPIHFLWWVVFLYISVIDMVNVPVSAIVRKRMPQNNVFARWEKYKGS